MHPSSSISNLSLFVTPSCFSPIVRMAFWGSVFLPILLILHCSSTRVVAGHANFKQRFSLSKLLSTRRRDGRSCFSYESRTHNAAIVLEMKHVDYCSRPAKEWDQSHEQRLAADNIRVGSIQSHVKNTLSRQTESSKAQIPITSGIKLQTLNYVVTLALGGRNVTVLVDTGSDLSWVQCQPCKSCYTQPEPLFNPLVSPSYQPVLCSSQSCNSLQYATGNSGWCENKAATCNYVVNYGDGSYTHGELGRDRLVLGSIEVDGFVFGCGRNNKGLFGVASGLVGLGRSDLSLVSQTTDLFGKVFSYCLPDTNAEASGTLMLGNDCSVYKNFTPFSYTRLVPNLLLSSFYILNLTGATLGGIDIEFPSLGRSVMIDSGTVITRLAPTIYKVVKSEFVKQFSGYPPAPSFSLLDTCFNLSEYREVDIPTLKMQFEDGAEMTVDVSGMFYFAKKDASQVCLALASLAHEDEMGIIGNYQQRNTRVVYDIEQMKVGFAREVCSYG